MKSYRNRMLTIAALALAAIGASAAPAAAQPTAKGKFTLPYEVKWQDAVLPAGEYTFTLESVAPPTRLILQGPKSLLIGAVTTSQRNKKGKSALSVEQHGGTRFVRELYLAILDRAILYRVPKISKEELARGPATTEQVPVAMDKRQVLGLKVAHQMMEEFFRPSN